jgi:hypothetical protein
MHPIRTATLIALTAGAFAAAPAQAAPAPVVGSGSFAKTIPFIDGDIYAFECHAVAPGAVSTSVNSCTLGPVAAPPATQAGEVAATAQGVSQDPRQTQVCWTVSATYADGTSQSSSGCSTTSDTAGAGASL